MRFTVPFVALMISGIVFAFVTPPFATPDETGHWLHAVAIASGASWGHVSAVTVPRWAVDFLDSYAPAGDISKLSNRPHAFPVTPGVKTVSLFMSSYDAVPYLPSAAGVFLGRISGASPIAIFRAGRIASTFVCSILIALAIAVCESGRAPLVLIALSPMAVALRASYSPDALLLAVSLALAALLTVHVSKTPLLYFVCAVSAAVVIVLIKPPYFPVAGLAAFAVGGGPCFAGMSSPSY